jgi:hypothetical protein
MDHVVTTTRSVRDCLDLTRPVDLRPFPIEDEAKKLGAEGRSGTKGRRRKEWQHQR